MRLTSADYYNATMSPAARRIARRAWFDGLRCRPIARPGDSSELRHFRRSHAADGGRLRGVFTACGVAAWLRAHHLSPASH